MDNTNTAQNISNTVSKSPVMENVELFLSGTFTRHQALRRLRMIKEFLNFKNFEVSGSAPEAGLEEFQKNYSEDSVRADTAADFEYLKKLGPTFFNRFNEKTLAEQLKEFEQVIMDAKTIILYTSFDVPKDETARLGQWFKTNAGAQTLIDIQFSGELIAGCALSYNGVYRDFSLRAQIDQSKQKILDTLLAFKK